MKKLVVIVLLLAACNTQSDRNVKKAEALMEKGRYREAAAVLEKLEEQNPTPKVYYLLGLSNARTKDIDRVERYFDLALSGDSGYTSHVIEAYTLLGKEYSASSQGDLGTRAFERVLELSPDADLGEHFYTMGGHYYEQEDFEKAIDSYQKGLLSVASSRRAIRARRYIVRSYHELGKRTEALEYCEQFLKIRKDQDLLYEKGTLSHELALESFERDSLARCMAYLKKVIEAGQPVPLQDDAHFLMGDLYLRWGDYRRAKKNFEAVLRLNPYGGSQLVKDAHERLRVIEQQEGGG